MAPLPCITPPAPEYETQGDSAILRPDDLLRFNSMFGDYLRAHRFAAAESKILLDTYLLRDSFLDLYRAAVQGGADAVGLELRLYLAAPMPTAVQATSTDAADRDGPLTSALLHPAYEPLLRTFQGRGQYATFDDLEEAVMGHVALLHPGDD